ncbi:GNAT family N-acetyltransferase [Paenibacillus marinisediminis]
MIENNIQVSIVNYHPDYAQSIADMWNSSQDSWGGGTSVRTAEQVIQQEASSDNLVLFLAICADEVVGYCSLCEFRDDIGALYIQLLNVRPDFHGKGVGKQLVLRCVEETIQRGWRRLDLHTWGSNMKAVPLYKRTGFFWEERDDQVHLMNFIPNVVACEALAPYIKDIDWYKDSTRIIEVRPDGVVENGFHTYSYTWEKDRHQLRVDFERRGRGICLIETEDYRISAHAESAEPVFGKSYAIEYRVVNKSGAPLHISFQGINDGNIKFDWQQTVDVIDEMALNARFYVGEIEEEPHEFRTCPAVTASVLINGLQVDMKLGVIPRFPAKLKLQVPDIMYAQNGRYDFYVDVENQFPSAAEFSFILPKVPWMELEQDQFSIRLAANEKASLTVPFRLLDYGFYEPRIVVESVTDTGESVSFSRSIGGGFGGPGAVLLGESDSKRYVLNGRSRLVMLKDYNQISLYNVGREQNRIVALFPRIGLPYSGEFGKKKPTSVEQLEMKGAAGYKHTYHSDAFPSLVLHTYTLLHADGTVKMWQELENVGESPILSDTRVSQRINMSLYRAVLPYEGRYVEMETTHGNEFDHWDADKVSEPWIYSRGENSGLGICWSDSHQMSFGNWFIDLESAIQELSPHEKRSTDAITLTIGGFEDWRSFRSFALKSSDQELPAPVVQDIELEVNQGNPFTASSSDGISAVLRDLKKNSWEGEVKAELAGEVHNCSFAADDDRTEASFMLNHPKQDFDTLQVEARLGVRDEAVHAALFKMSGSIDYSQTEDAGHIIQEADNGKIRISAAAGYYCGLRSLQVNGREWLASDFPNYSAKSWWNPWIGGIYDQVSNMRAHNLIPEERSGGIAYMIDQHGNEWSGIRMSQSIKEHKLFKGLKWDTYYMMLPGVPALAIVTDVHQRTGTYLEEDRSWYTQMFLQPGEDQDHGWLRTYSVNGSPIRYLLGQGELYAEESTHYAIGHHGEPDIMHVVTDEYRVSPSIQSNKEVSVLSFSRKLGIPHGKSVRLTPIILVFADELLPESSLKSLRGLTFILKEKHALVEGV